jgi:hypothetical protein
MNGKIRVSVVAAGLQQTVVRAAPQPVRELQAGLNTAIFNTPSPAAELGIVAQPSAFMPPPQKTIITAPSAQPHATVPPSEYRPAPPVIRARPMPQPEPAHDIFDTEPQHEPAAQAQPAAETPKDRSFASLFGWKAKPADEHAAPAARPVPADDDTFDDDLEIPAFLRRSGNA